MFVSEIYDEAAEILGTSDQQRIFKKLTQAIAALMESGNWFHGNQEVDVCTGWDGYTLTLPRGIEVPLAVNIDGSPTYFRDRLFQYHVNKGGAFSTVPWAWDDRGVVATNMDIRQPSEVVAVAENPNDAGQVIRLVGTDSNGRTITSQLDDGTLVDGLLIPIHALTDFEYGVITPDGNRVNTRQVAISPFTNFISSTAHYLSSGQPITISPVSGVLPSPLVSGNQYYVGAVNSTTVELYSDPLYAELGELPIQLQSIAGAGPISMVDAIESQVVTSVALQTSGGSPTTSPLVVNPANEVVFSEISSQQLPTTLIAGATYFANQLDPNDLQVFETISDATNNVNPVYLSGNTAPFNVDIRTPVTPQTQFQMPSAFLYSTGDVVQVYNNSGQLPAPLIAAQNYYVHVVAGLSGIITLHTNVVDATAGTNPITVTSTGTGQSSIVKIIPATSNVGSTSQITAPGINIPAPVGSGASIVPIVTGSVVGTNVTFGGTSYNSVPTVTFSAPTYTPPENSNQAVRTATGYAIVTSLVVTSIVITDGGAGYTSPPTITLTGGGYGSIATASASIATSFVGNYTVNNGGSGYLYPPLLTISGGGGSGATATCQVIGGSITAVYPVALGTGYASAPAVSVQPSTGVTLQFSSTGTLPSPMQAGVAYIAATPLNTSTGTFTVLNADGSTLQTTSTASGSFTVDVTYPLGVTPSNVWGGNFSGLTSGAKIYFGTDYLLPTTTPPIDSGVTPFYIRPLTTTTAEFFSTSQQAEGQIYSVSILTGGTGYTSAPVVAISDPTGSGAAITATVSSGVVTALTITSAGSGYTNPTISFTGGAGSGATASVNTGIVQSTAIGTGQSYIAARLQAVASPYQNLISPDSVQYLQNGQPVQFSISSGGTLPGGIAANTPYTLQLNGGNISLAGVTLTSIPTGLLSMNVVNTFTAQAATTIAAESSAYSTGTAIIPRPNTGDILDPSLVAGATYYVRRIDPNSFSLYATYDEAMAGGSTGLLSYVTTGNTIASTFFVDAVTPPTLVKAVQHVQKPVTQGYVSLYAFDYGRSNDMCLIGQYHPSETNPKYRRVRLGKPCAWARIMYRAKAPVVTSVYDYLPLEQSRALICAIHAIDLEDKDFADQAAKYWARADGYLKNLQTSMDGHAMSAVQVDEFWAPGYGVVMM